MRCKKYLRSHPSPQRPSTPLHEHRSVPGNKVFLISLGCAKNRVDSEHILGILSCSGYTIVQSLKEADIAVVNTCGFVQEAVEEAIGAILEISREKKKGRLKRLYVAGCLVQRYGYKLKRELPEVDGWAGTGEIGRIAEIIAGKVPFRIGPPGFVGDDETPRVATTPFYSAYVKIAEGCDHRCTYCTIPGIRGPYRSRPIRSIVREVEKMAERGVAEINLVAQDTTMYGCDLGRGNRLEDLLEALLRIRNIPWIRMMYAHPLRISEGLLDLIEQEERICPYLDVPLQHVHPFILREMGRAGCRETPWRLVERIRRRKREIAIRTTMIVGFPGETETIFQELLGFLQSAELDHVGIFGFSPEEGTAAARLASRIDPRIAQERRDRLMRAQAKISRRKHRDLVGKVLPVLVEGVSPETEFLLTGRTCTMAPEVDGQVLISKGTGSIGRIAPIRIRASHTYDLVGEFA